MKKTKEKITHSPYIPKDEKENQEILELIEEVKKEKTDYSKLKKTPPEINEKE